MTFSGQCFDGRMCVYQSDDSVESETEFAIVEAREQRCRKERQKERALVKSLVDRQRTAEEETGHYNQLVHITKRK